MSTDIKQKCFDSIEELFKKYENNDYMLQRIHNHVAVSYTHLTLPTKRIV